MRERGFLILLLLFLPAHPLVAEEPPLTCTLSGPATFPLGSTPSFRVTIRNQTGHDILLVGSLDASDVRWRYPHCYFEVSGPDGKPAVASPGRCGVMNALRVKDFVAVAKGDSFDPYTPDHGFFSNYQLTALTFRHPGTYRMRFVYSTESTDLRSWQGGDSDALRSLLAQVPKTTVVSNEVTIEIVTPGE